MCCSPKGNPILFTAFGLSLLFVGILFTGFWQLLIESQAKKQLVLAPGSYAYDFWKKVPFPIYYDIYLFNVTNAEDVVKDGSDPVLQEVGPYVYSEHRTKHNITFHPNGTVSYEQKKVYYFEREKTPTTLSTSDMITHLNMALVGAAGNIKYVHGDYEFLYYAINEACKRTDKGVDCSLFMKHNVSELLFDGYDDPLIKSAHDSQLFVSMPYDRFAFFIGRNNTAADGMYTMFTGDKDIDRLGFMDRWQNRSHIGYFINGSKCDTFGYSSAGDFRPPYLMTKSRAPIYMFVGDICRSFRLDFHEEVDRNGIPCQRFVADENLFDYSLIENQCFCETADKCPLNGVANVSLCVFGAPIFVSYPHFLYAHPKYLEQLVGLHPDPSKHMFYMDIEPTLALPISANAKMQINVLLERYELLPQSDLANITLKHIFMPQLWTGISVQLDDDMTNKIKLIVKVVPLVCNILSALLITSGALLLLSVLYFKYFRNTKEVMKK